MLNIIIIGFGNIGFRHFQSLMNQKEKSNIIIVDHNIKNKKKIAKVRNTKKHIITFDDKLSSYKLVFDFAIIATNSDVRLKVISKLIDLNKIKFLLIEKMVTYKIEEYQKITKILKKNKIITYVNFIRREFLFYSKLKTLLKNDLFRITINYSNLGLCSNSIHFLDLFCLLTGVNNIQLKKNLLYNNIYRSKRNGFFEFKGSLVFISAKGHELVINDRINQLNKNLIIIDTNKKQFIIDESKKICKFSINSKVKKMKVDTKLVSETTNIILKKIITNKEIKLTKIENSFNNHKILIKLFNNHFNKLNKKSLTFKIT